MMRIRVFDRWIKGLVLLLFPFLCSAEETVSRPVIPAYSLEAGAVSVLDTYLSPLRYHGSRWAMSGEWMKALPAAPEKLRMEFRGRMSTCFTTSSTGGPGIYSLSGEFCWGLMRAWSVGDDLVVSAGASADLYAGCLFTPSSGNNPASAKASLFLSPALSISRPLKIGRINALLSDRVSVPSAGLFFSPQYGEPYYEIWIGNHSGLAHFGWWGNHFCINNTLAADLRLGRHGLRVGYIFDVRSSWICHINTQIISHSICIGFLPSGCARGASSAEPGIINPYF